MAAVLPFTAMVPLGAQAPGQSDLNAIYQIKDEGFSRSQVMETMSYLTDVYGPRLTNSPNIKQAAEWTTGKMKEWQLSNVHLEPWGPFGKGWSNEKFSVQVISPRPFPLIAYPKAWTPGTNGPVTAEAVWAPIQKEEDIEKYRGKLKGKFVLTAASPEVPARFEAQGHRYTDAELAETATEPVPGARPGGEDRFARFRAQRELNEKIQKFLVEEGIAVWIEPSQGDDGTVFVSSGGGRDPKDPPAPTRVAVASENYGRLVRMLEKKVAVT
jgi:carboxypeptidase Q